MPAQNILIILCELKKEGPFFPKKCCSRPSTLYPFTIWEFLSTIFLGFGWIELVSVEMHGVTRSFSFYWFTNLFGWKENKREHIKLILNPHIWDPNQSIPFLQNIPHTLSYTWLLLGKASSHWWCWNLYISTIQSLATFSAHVTLLLTLQTEISYSHTHLESVLFAQSSIYIEISGK